MHIYFSNDALVSGEIFENRQIKSSDPLVTTEFYSRLSQLGYSSTDAVRKIEQVCEIGYELIEKPAFSVSANRVPHLEGIGAFGIGSVSISSRSCPTAALPVLWREGIISGKNGSFYWKRLVVRK